MIQSEISPNLPSRQPVVLFVDDDQRILRGVERLFRQAHVPWGYAFAGGADEALALLADREVDAMISDVRMPGRDGFELLSQLRNSGPWADLPIVMLTGINDPGLKNRALDLGATDLLNKPVNPDDLFARIRSVLQLKRYQDIIKCQNSHLEELVRRRTESLAATRLEMIWRLARAAEYKSNETGNHVIRVGHYAKALALRLDLDAERVEMIFLTSPLHDLGKIGIPDRILMKEGPLSPEEWQTMQGHCDIGRELLSHPQGADRMPELALALPARQPGEVEENPSLQMAAEIAGCHHEQWSGGGYPRGLRGEEIPLAARIVAVADVYDALRNRRSYKPGMSHVETVALMAQNSGGHFDPEIFTAFLACQEQFQKIHQRLAE